MADAAETGIVTGAARLATEDFSPFAGKRIGLITHEPADVNGESLAARLRRAKNVTLTALFVPEHGLQANRAAGEALGDDAVSPGEQDAIPIVSLYGPRRAPEPHMLSELDLLVFDLQDVGAGFYTYISTLGLAMAAAAKAKLPFFVLDRPNPLGGEQIAGPIREKGKTDFVGLYPLPVIHGLTVGELARMIQGEKWLPGVGEVTLHVIAMAGWRRHMLWPDTGLPWRAPSPALPHFFSALAYPGMALLEATRATDGRGTKSPFLRFAMEEGQGQQLAAELRACGLPGVSFRHDHFAIDFSKAGPFAKGLPSKRFSGVALTITNPRNYRPWAVGVHVLHVLCRRFGLRHVIDRPAWLGRLAGMDDLYWALRHGRSPQRILAREESDIARFRDRRTQYLLYD